MPWPPGDFSTVLEMIVETVISFARNDKAGLFLLDGHGRNNNYLTFNYFCVTPCQPGVSL